MNQDNIVCTLINIYTLQQSNIWLPPSSLKFPVDNHGTLGHVKHDMSTPGYLHSVYPNRFEGHLHVSFVVGVVQTIVRGDAQLCASVKILHSHSPSDLSLLELRNPVRKRLKDSESSQ